MRSYDKDNRTTPLPFVVKINATQRFLCDCPIKFFGVIFRAVVFVIRLVLLVKWAELKNWTVPKMFSETAKANPDKVMFYFEDQEWTFKQVTR